MELKNENQEPKHLITQEQAARYAEETANGLSEGLFVSVIKWLDKNGQDPKGNQDAVMLMIRGIANDPAVCEPVVGEPVYPFKESFYSHLEKDQIELQPNYLSIILGPDAVSRKEADVRKLARVVGAGRSLEFLEANKAEAIAAFELMKKMSGNHMTGEGGPETKAAGS